MSMYLLPANPTSSTIPLTSLQRRARRAGYWLQRDRHVPASFSLIDRRLGMPITRLDHVPLGEIVVALDRVLL